jgi:hypothetical protein
MQYILFKYISILFILWQWWDVLPQGANVAAWLQWGW